MSARRNSGRGVLVILALFLAASGAIHLGSGLGQALAEASGQEGSAEGEAAPALNCPAPPLALAEALTRREANVLEQETALRERLAALKLAEQAITTRMAELEAAETRLRETLSLADGAAEEDITRLTAVYEAMKPKDAAALFETMTPEFAAGFLGRMQPAAAAAVLSGMSAEAAYGVSVLIAGRNATAPKE